MALLTLTPLLARRLAITRQRLAGPRPLATPAGVMELMRDLGCIQLDPIQAVERSQYLVLWSRLGSYDPAHLDTLLWPERQLFEYWAHAASIVLTENYPIHQFQMRCSVQDQSSWGKRVQTWLRENEPFRQYLLAQLRQNGPLALDQLEDRSLIPWQSGGWTAGRNLSQMLHFMWTRGEIMVAERSGGQKKWALTEQCLPEWAAHAPLPEAEIVRRAAQISLRALGVATAKQINQHFIRGYYPALAQALAGLVAEGSITPALIRESGVTWPGEWYVHAADLPLLERLVAGEWQPWTTLLSPFDNLLCDRERTDLMWDFHFRLEIYVPQAKRQYGYYVLPILHGDRLIGRIDPRIDRKTGVLHVHAIYAEPNAPEDATTGQAIAAAIADLAHFLGARTIRLGECVPAGWQPALLQVT